MNGAEGITAGLRAHLAAHLPAALADLAAALELPAGDLPPPKVMAPKTGQRLRLALDDFPAVAIIVGEARAAGRADATATGIVYDFDYLCRLFVFARGNASDGPPPVDPEDDATARRNRYTLAVRESFHAHQRLPGLDASVDLAGWRESYSETSPVDQTVAVGAAYCEVRVRSSETLGEQLAGWTPTEAEVDGDPMAPGPIRVPSGSLLPTIEVTVDRRPV